MNDALLTQAEEIEYLKREVLFANEAARKWKRLYEEAQKKLTRAQLLRVEPYALKETKLTP